MAEGMKMLFRNPSNLGPQKYREKAYLFYQQYFSE